MMVIGDTNAIGKRLYVAACDSSYSANEHLISTSLFEARYVASDWLESGPSVYL